MKKTSFIMLAAVIVIVNYMPLFMGGYLYNEEQAIRRSFPLFTGATLYEKVLDGDKFMIWHDGSAKNITLIESKWELLHRVKDFGVLMRRSDEEPFIRTWSSSFNGNNYNTLLAVETSEPESKKILVTNEPWDDKPLNDLDQIKALSGVYIEMDVEQGYAVHFEQLPIDQAGGFVFRSIDSEGNILSVLR